MKNHQRRIISIGLLAFFVFTAVFPLLSLAAWAPGDAIIPECSVDGSGVCGWRWLELITLANNLISAGIYFSVLVAVVAFIFAGFKYLTAGGNEGQIKQAHTIFRNVALGLIIVLAAWLIVHTIIIGLVPTDKAGDYSLLS